MKDIKILVSSILIILSFFIWYFYSEQRFKSNYSIGNTDEKSYVNVNINKTKVSIDNQNKNIIILVNWEEINENSEINF